MDKRIKTMFGTLVISEPVLLSKFDKDVFVAMMKVKQSTQEHPYGESTIDDICEYLDTLGSTAVANSVMRIFGSSKLIVDIYMPYASTRQEVMVNPIEAVMTNNDGSRTEKVIFSEWGVALKSIASRFEFELVDDKEDSDGVD